MTIIEGKRYDLSKLYEVPGSEGEQIGTGVTREGVWVTKSGRVIVKTDSIWENPLTHGCYGASYHFADADEIARLADELEDKKLIDLVPIAEDA